MAILSVSRRTDIPTYHSEWFMDKLRQGKVACRNPFNPANVSIIPLNREVIDCICFWTKNAIPMLDKIDDLNAYDIPYYFQYTVTGYGKDMEKNIPDKECIISNFIALSEKCSHHMIWRYDPILFNETYTMDWHLERFRYIAQRLCGYTDKCVISFVDDYYSLRNVDYKSISSVSTASLEAFCTSLSEIAKEYDMKVCTCAEQIDLEKCGISHNHCIDKEYIESIIGCRLDISKDNNQRKACGCYESIDIGAYDTCMNGCRYCYACKNQNNIEKKMSCRNVKSLLLCDEITKMDKCTERKVKSCRQEQLCLFDLL